MQALPKTTRFINFGCWNKNAASDKNSGIVHVSKALELEDKIDFFIVNGDNYYQDKNEADGTKSVNVANLNAGFELLNNSNQQSFHAKIQRNLFHPNQKDVRGYFLQKKKRFSMLQPQTFSILLKKNIFSLNFNK